MPNSIFFWRIIIFSFVPLVGSLGIIPDKHVVVGCANIPDAEKGVALHKIPFYGDDRSEGRNGQTC